MGIVRHEQEKILSSAVEHNGLVWVAGTVADDLTRDVKGQTAGILAEIDRVLALAGTDKSKILSATIWLTDIRNRAEMNEVWLKWVDPGNLPARACIEAKLADPRMLVEIACVAAR